MRVSIGWDDYALLDAGDGNRLERWGEITLQRPDPQAIFAKSHPELWQDVDAVYIRSREGGGGWQFNKALPKRWSISYDEMKFIVSPTGFKHTGLFPEQAVNWRFYTEKIMSAKRSISVLNLFGYTGAATMFCLRADAQVVHIDASKGITMWAKENAQKNGLNEKPCRWIVDDCNKFLQREIRRGSRYDAIIMDPPSYGRGPGGEVWQLEKELQKLVETAANLLSKTPLFIAINSYSTGISQSVSAIMLRQYTSATKITAEEIGLSIKNTPLVLPCGGTAIAEY